MVDEPTGQTVDRPRSQWTLLSNHGHVLVCVAADPDARLRDIAARVGITERATNTILNDLTEAGMVERTKTGRRNSYRIVRTTRLRHPLEADHSVGELIDTLASISGTSLDG